MILRQILNTVKTILSVRSNIKQKPVLCNFPIPYMEAKENHKKPQFGTRYLKDPNKVFSCNAWDDVEWTDDLTKEAETKIKSNSEFIVPVEEQEKYESKANLFWDQFYNIHQNRFFKDRHWLFTEFPELSVKSFIEENESTLKSIKEESPSASASETVYIWEVGCGVGNTVFPILETNIDSDVFVYCCDFSEVAISIVKEHPNFDSKHCLPFVCDISAESWNVPFKEDSLNYIILIYVLSAIHPEKMSRILNKLAKYLKPGGEILFRDYGRYDMVQLRFKPGKCLTDHFYVRGDGTRVYFFTEDEVDNLMKGAGLEKVQLRSSKTLQVNRGKQLKMFRIWIQAKYKKPLVQLKNL